MHNPNLTECPLNQMSFRQAMGLPQHFTPNRLNDASAWVRKLRGCSEHSLLDLLASQEPVVQRFAAATLLGLQGDPRIGNFPEMVEIPGFEAVIGIDPSETMQESCAYSHLGILEEWIAKEEPKHKVRLPDFRMGKYQVTVGQYKLFLEDSHYPYLPEGWLFGFPQFPDNHPVYTVTYKDAQAYCAWLSEKLSRPFRLPTEQEWEAAASGPQHLRFPWGMNWQPDCANTAEESLFCSTPVGIFSKGRSPYGLYDMAGNVEEFTSSLYQAYPGGVFIEDDLVNSVGEYHIARGGSFSRFRDLARTTRRHGHYGSQLYVMGFRVCEDK